MDITRLNLCSDAEFNRMPASELAGAMIAYARGYNGLVADSVRRPSYIYSWDMNVWVQRHSECPDCNPDDIWSPRCVPGCGANLAGAMLVVRQEKPDEDNLPWRRRVEALRLGVLWRALTHEDRWRLTHRADLEEVEDWFVDHRPESSASRGDAWSPQDPGFFTELASRLEQLGV